MDASQRRIIESLAARLSGGPVEPFLVGGCVRDLMIGRPPRDIDLLLACPPGDEEKALRTLASIAGMDPIPFDRRTPATFRVVSGGTIIDTSFCEPGRIDEALRRRDFTINAMAAPLASLAAGESPDSSTLIDPLGGRADLEARLIRLATPEAITDDPLRMLRAVRLAAVLDGFTLDESLLLEIQARAPRIDEPARERVSLEMEQILESPGAGPALRGLDDLDLLVRIFPELEPLRGLEQPVRYHAHDALEHSLRAVEEAESILASGHPAGFRLTDPQAALIIKWSALLHDVGKSATASVGEDGAIHFYGHEHVSARLAEKCLERLRVPGRVSAPVVELISLHLRPGSLAATSPGDRPLRRLLGAAGPRFRELAVLSLADRRASGGPAGKELEEKLLALTRRALRLEEEVRSLSTLPPLLGGDEVMKILNLDPGPRVGSLLAWIERLRLEDKISTREEAIRMLEELPDPAIED